MLPFHRDGLTLTVHCSTEAAAANLERLFYFWPVDDPPPPTKSRVTAIEAAMAAAKRTPRTLELDD
jgi:hypothetical protein